MVTLRHRQMEELKIIFKNKYMRIFHYLLIFLLFPVALSCSKEKEEVDWTEEKNIEVNSCIVPVWAFCSQGKVDGFQIRAVGSEKWEAVPYYFIKGFKFEEGYFYILKVKYTHLVDPPADSANVECELISVIAKVKE